MKKVILAAIIVFIALCLNAYDTSYTVKQDGTGDYTNIQSAINAVSNGTSAIIYVYGSTTAYTGTNNTNLTWNGSNKHIWLRGVEVNGLKPKITGYAPVSRAVHLSGSSINNIDRISGFEFEFDAYLNYSTTIYNGIAILIENGAAPIIEDCLFSDAWIVGNNYACGGAIFCDGPAIIRDCTIKDFYSQEMIGGTGLTIKNGPAVENCIFENLYSTYCVGSRTGPVGVAVYILPSTTGDINIKNCILSGNEIESLGDTGIIYIEADTNNTDIYFTNNIFTDETPNGSLVYCKNITGIASFVNCAFYENGGSIFSIDYSNDVFIDYCLTDESGFAYNYTPGTNCLIDTDPLLNSTTYQPIWTSTVKSSCIDAGDPTLTDADGTRSDIGAVCAIDHNYDLIELPDPTVDNGYKWISFPSLDVVLDDEDIAENVLADVLDPNILEYFDSGQYKIEYNSGNLTWYYDDEQLSCTAGYVFKMLDDAEFDISGFKIADNTTVSLTGNSYENWLGYWLEEIQTLADAFGDEWTSGNIYSIQHQDWSAYYSEGTWKYKSMQSGRPALSLSYGDMVKVKCHNTISSFCWDNGTPEDPRSSSADPSYYTFTEQADYTPIFIEVDETNPPSEIGAFVDSVCIGATVVEGDMAQINAYTKNTAPGEIELELYYGSRGSMQLERITSYKCRNSNDPQQVHTQLNSGDNSDAWFVSFNQESDLVQSLEQVSISNYPNPFNPTTTISYNIPLEGNVSLKIYNTKGQLVKQLVNGTQPEGYYDVIWNGKDAAGKQVSSGIYYYQIDACGKTINKKMLMLK